jgi:hypothetical protein
MKHQTELWSAKPRSALPNCHAHHVQTDRQREREREREHATVLLVLIHTYSESFIIPLKYQARQNMAISMNCLLNAIRQSYEGGSNINPPQSTVTNEHKPSKCSLVGWWGEEWGPLLLCPLPLPFSRPHNERERGNSYCCTTHYNEVSRERKCWAYCNLDEIVLTVWGIDALNNSSESLARKVPRMRSRRKHQSPAAPANEHKFFERCSSSETY